MLEELYTGNDGRAAGATDDAVEVAASAPVGAVPSAAMATPAIPAAARSASLSAAAPRMEGVPSEQLWRAAILAARQAALAAADLRRALAESARSPIVASPDDASVPLVS